MKKQHELGTKSQNANRKLYLVLIEISAINKTKKYNKTNLKNQL